MYNKLSNYSQRMFKEADVLKADPCICLKGSRQITKNLRRYRRCHDGGSYSTPSKYSVIVIATRYGLHGPGIKSRWGGEIFRTCPDRLWGPPSLLYNEYGVFPGGKTAGVWRWLLAISSIEGKERVKLYLYCPIWTSVACSKVNFSPSKYSKVKKMLSFSWF